MPRSRAAPLTPHRGASQRVGTVNRADRTHRSAVYALFGQRSYTMAFCGTTTRNTADCSRSQQLIMQRSLTYKHSGVYVRLVERFFNGIAKPDSIKWSVGVSGDLDLHYDMV